MSEPTFPLFRPEPERAVAGAEGAGLRVAIADPGGDDSAAAGQPRRARPGADRHRQDRGVSRCRSCRASISNKPRRRRWCWRRRVNWRSRSPKRSSLRAHIPGFHVLPIYGGQSYGPQLSALAPRRARGGRYAGPRHRSPGKRFARPVEAQDAGAGRSRRDAAHGLYRRCRSDPAKDAGIAPDRVVLGDHAIGDRRIAQTYLRDPSESRSPPRPVPMTTSASATGWSAACTSWMR
jgi:hypothetical protein